MYKVKINYDGAYGKLVINTSLPKIPSKDESIGFWNGDRWIVADVISVGHVLSRLNNYLLTEICVIDEL